MLWNVEPFVAVHEGLMAATNDDGSIENVLAPIQDDLQQLLTTPPKSTSSRERLSKKFIEIGEETVEVNEAFINEAARVADELNLDEIVAAKLVFYSINDARRLEISLFESALTLFFVRRQYIVDIVRYGMESLPVEKVDLLLGKTSGRLAKLLNQLKQVEGTLEAIDDRAKSGEFMGLDKDPNFRRILKLQREFLILEHETLGNIVYAYLNAFSESEDQPELAIGLLKHMAGLDVLDSRVLSYYLPFAKWMSAHHSDEFMLPLWSYFVNNNSSNEDWKLPSLKAGMSLVVFTALADEERTLPSSLQFKDILSATRSAIDSGGLEFWMALAQDVKTSSGEAYFDKYRPLVRSRVPALVLWRTMPNSITLRNFQDAMELLMVAFITNLADILKQMRLSEEDMYLAMNELQESGTTIFPGADFERFLLFVAIVCRNQPKTSYRFFEDEGDALYGFLLWTTDCQVTLMSATFTELIASLANDEPTAKLVHNFLQESLKLSQNEDGFTLSWVSICDVIDYYTRGLSLSIHSNVIDSSAFRPGSSAIPRPAYGFASTSDASSNMAIYPFTNQAMFSSKPSYAFEGPTEANSIYWGMPDTAVTGAHSSVPSTQQQPDQLSDDSLLIMAAYMNLISRVAGACQEARDYILDKEKRPEASESSLTTLLFKLLKLQQPIKGPIFNALSPFVSADMWVMLDSTILGKLEDSLTSVDDTLAFVHLIVKLCMAAPTSKHTKDYVEFVSTSILPWTTTVQDKGTAFQVTCNVIQCECLVLLRDLLHEEDTRELAFRICLVPKVYDALFTILTVGLDQLSKLEPGHVLVRTVTTCVNVLTGLVKWSISSTLNFDKPILYHLQVVPHLALYAGSTHKALSLASLHLLSLLDQTKEFRATVNRQSRILSTLSSSTESTRIRVGLLVRLEDEVTSVEVKKSILEMVLAQLQDSGTPKHFMTVAHYLLGFSKAELGLELRLELEKGIGGILSGHSLLSSICNLILKSNVLLKDADGHVLRLCAEVLLHLVADPLTSELVLDYLRQFDFWLNTMTLEPGAIKFSDTTDELLNYRAALMETWIYEVQFCHKRLLLTVESHYINALAPIVFNLVDFTVQIPNNRTAYRCLKAWCKLIPVLITSGGLKTDSAFISSTMQLLSTKLPDYSRQDADFAVPISSLLVFLTEKHYEQGSDASTARQTLSLLRAALFSLQPAQLNKELRANLYTICFHNFKNDIEAGSNRTQAEALELLTSCGPRILRAACDDVLCDSNESVRMGALLFLQMAVLLSGRFGSLLAVESLLQYNFVSIFISEVLEPALMALERNSEADGVVKHVPSHKEVIVRRTTGDFDTKLGLEGQRHTIQNQKGETIVYVPKRTVSIDILVAEISLSVLIPIAGLRKGAVEILHSNLVRSMCNDLCKFPEEVLSLLLQLLIALVVSSGSENVLVRRELQSIIDRNRSSIQSILRRDSEMSQTIQDQSVESENSHLARKFTILIGLVEAI